MRIANLFEDRDILAMSQEAAKKIMAEDRHLESEKYSGLRKRAESIISDDIVMKLVKIVCLYFRILHKL